MINRNHAISRVHLHIVGVVIGQGDMPGDGVVNHRIVADLPGQVIKIQSVMSSLGIITGKRVGAERHGIKPLCQAIKSSTTSLVVIPIKEDAHPRVEGLGGDGLGGGSPDKLPGSTEVRGI